ncbi:hypothetical protein P692DRAFT_20834724 [Suillus brevipes Sb2]|nr:hypothetical protein P692DRAFT_20834724 [Suillus brevipes Sb2]
MALLAILSRSMGRGLKRLTNGAPQNLTPILVSIAPSGPLAHLQTIDRYQAA